MTWLRSASYGKDQQKKWVCPRQASDYRLYLLHEHSIGAVPRKQR